MYVALPVSDKQCVSSEYIANASSVDRVSHSGVELCPYAAHGHCPYADQCMYVHGDVCDLCHCAVLSPFDLDQRQRHTEVSVHSIIDFLSLLILRSVRNSSVFSNDSLLLT